MLRLVVDDDAVEVEEDGGRHGEEITGWRRGVKREARMA
jgi:hypothetical protein